MESRRVSESSIVMSQLMTQHDANLAGNVHGGVIMKLMDTAAGVVATRHTRMNVVTASIDRLNFHAPVFTGDLVILKASVNIVGRTSMEVGVRVDAEDLISGESRYAASAYITYVALDRDGKPTAVPGIIPETDDELRRNREAKTRREARIKQDSI